MKQVININFQGRVVPIEVTAFEMLKAYTESLSRHFANEEGRDEIINDIENRIGELFQERLQEGATCITDEHVNAVINSIGRPEEFDDADQAESAARETFGAGPQGFQASKKLYRDENEKVIGGVCSGLANYFGIDVVVVRILFVILVVTFGVGILPYIILWIAVPSSANTTIGARRKKLYRDTDDRIIAGVCSGIGHYFGINAWIPRILFLIPFLSIATRIGDWDFFPSVFSIGFSPGAFFLYIILWLVLPEATTTAEKLEMKGEKVDLNSIKNSVMTEMKDMQQRAEKMGKQAREFASAKGKAMSSDASAFAKRSGNSFGDVLALLFKIFIYCVMGFIALIMLIVLISLGVASLGFFPLKNFILTDGWQNYLAWGTFLFFIITPILGIIVWVIRRLTRVKTNRGPLRFSFSALWILGWFCCIALFVSLARDFRSTSTPRENEIALDSTLTNKLIITAQHPDQPRYSATRWLRLEPFEHLDEDTLFVKNISVKIAKSPDSNYRVTLMPRAEGRTRRYADTLAASIQFNAVQMDSLLVVDKGLPITRESKFRNQRVILTVYVPVGKQIRVHNSLRERMNLMVYSPFTKRIQIEWDEEETDWRVDEDYIMTEDGLYTLNNQPAGYWKKSYRSRWNSDDSDIHYRYDGPSVSDSINSNLRKAGDKIRDTKEQLKQEINRELEDALNDLQEQTSQLFSTRKAEKKKEKNTLPPTFNHRMPTFNPMLLAY